MESAIFGLIGVVVGSLLSTANDWWFENRSRQKNLEYLSIRIVSIFDHFINSCLDVCRDDGLLNNDGYRVPQVDTPKLDLSTLDVEWKSVPTNYLYEILNFPSLIDDANSYIISIVDHVAGPPDYKEAFEARIEKFSNLGLQALDISEKLRKIANLPDSIESEDDWSKRELLKRFQSEVG